MHKEMELESDDPSLSLEKRPSVIFVGSPNSGKRTLISRLTSLDFEDSYDSTISQDMLHGWSIDTKYYSVDVSVCVAHLHDGFSITSLPIYSRLAALIMVFDVTDRSSLVSLQKWVSRNDLRRFEVLLCIGNKVDLIPDHPVHSEYRRRLLKLGEEDSFSNGYDFEDYGISGTEGSSLLGGEKEDSFSFSEMKKSCLEWCIDNNIEFVEACGSNADFDKCLSVDGDSQGVERLFGALSAHMWPGMRLKSGDKIADPLLPEGIEDLSDEEDSDFELEYEKLSAGSAEPWDDTDSAWVSASSSSSNQHVDQDNLNTSENYIGKGKSCEINDATASTSVSNSNEAALEEELNQEKEDEGSPHFDFDELGHVMAEISNIRDNLRLMPDHQRREMAANMALKMAGMFGGYSDDEGN